MAAPVSGVPEQVDGWTTPGGGAWQGVQTVPIPFQASGVEWSFRGTASI
ncbi:hypothetical protein J5X98_27150 [Leptothermofonsia sichuanensis E412]|nr:hypothetical protein [Leptothermofonsia sichuanensis]QZZ20836.1 hypothetical protein J5X98_27150 [Leptothermofonsia sichuanensis E412]